VRRFCAGAVAACLLLALTACDDDVGEVAVKAMSGFSVPPLTVGEDRLLGPEGTRFRTKDDGSSTVLRQAPGPARLLYERGGENFTACTFKVRKDRVVTVTVRVVGREVKCEIMD
jgi:hypothetical protein